MGNNTRAKNRKPVLQHRASTNARNGEYGNRDIHNVYEIHTGRESFDQPFSFWEDEKHVQEEAKSETESQQVQWCVEPREARREICPGRRN